MSDSIADNPRSRFADMVSREDEIIDLAEAALLIAAEEYAGLDVGLYLEKLDRLGDLARERAEGARNASDMIAALNATLFDELGFCGNRENYYDPRNSFLNEVLDHRTGIPITLTVVYMETARRIGFSVQGVGMPGHFIAKHASDEGDIFIDPFNDGRLLGEAGCAELLAEMSGGRLGLQPSHLLAVTNKQILTRMLSNLLGIYANSTDHARSLAAIERILLINPDSPPHVRDRGLLLAALGKTAAALAELKRYLTLAPEARDAAVIKEQIKSIQQTLARLN
ncbi:MAG: transglutaminase-like domain-containing protein [Blastocatellia bacterium]|nr:transglutaminase-like domain-containing protein [Blastocatellia bacterium]